MKKLMPPDRNDCQLHIETAFTYIDSRKKFNITEEELLTVSEIYDEYDLLKGEAVENFKSIKLTDYLNNALSDSYNEVQEKGRLKGLRQSILLSINRCPFCGISDADEIDHYLPKSLYKSVGIYCRNLIPICHICNNKKRTIDGIKPNQKKVPHIYFDDFLENHFLIAKVNLTEGALIVNFGVIDTNLLSEEAERINFIFERLEINERLNKEVNIYLSAFSISLEQSFKEFNEESVKAFLFNQYKQNLKKFGINDWRTALVLGLSECAEFCNGGFKEYFDNS